MYVCVCVHLQNMCFLSWASITKQLCVLNFETRAGFFVSSLFATFCFKKEATVMHSAFPLNTETQQDLSASCDTAVSFSETGRNTTGIQKSELDETGKGKRA